MAKVLILTLHRPDRSPSQRFRFEQYLGFLKENGFDYDFSYLLNQEDDKIYYSKGNYFKKLRIVVKSLFKRLKELKTIKNYDLVFVQRESFMLGTSYFEEKIAKKGAKLIFDFDDSIWLQNVSDANKAFVWLKDSKKTARIIQCSTLVIAGNQYLADYAKDFNQNVIIIPTTIDTEEYSKIDQEKSNKICIGWSGSITTINHFETGMPFLIKIKEKYGDKIEFKVVGDGNYKNEQLGIHGYPWKKDTELTHLSSFDIGIMPLHNNEWAKGKCGLKGLQYMALGVPTIMTAIGVNTEIIQDGENGYLALEEDEWIERLSALIESKELRDKIGENGRKTVLEKYSVIANQQLYLDTLKKLLNS